MRNDLVLVPLKNWIEKNGLPVECDRKMHLRPETYFATYTFTQAFLVCEVTFSNEGILFSTKLMSPAKFSLEKVSMIFNDSSTKLRELNTVPPITHFPDDTFLELDVEWWIFLAFGEVFWYSCSLMCTIYWANICHLHPVFLSIQYKFYSLLIQKRS